jgi:hypothetical protein
MEDSLGPTVDRTILANLDIALSNKPSRAIQTLNNRPVTYG